MHSAIISPLPSSSKMYVLRSPGTRSENQPTRSVNCTRADVLNQPPETADELPTLYLFGRLARHSPKALDSVDVYHNTLVHISNSGQL